MEKSRLYILLLLFVLSAIGCEKPNFGLTEPVDIYIPNIFAPSSNIENSLFYIHTSLDNAELMVEIMEIFDRFGNVVFKEQNFPPNDRTYSWDGTFRGELVEAGTYTYSIELTDGIGTSRIVGDFVLIR